MSFKITYLAMSLTIFMASSLFAGEEECHYYPFGEQAVGKHMLEVGYDNEKETPFLCVYGWNGGVTSSGYYHGYLYKAANPEFFNFILGQLHFAIQNGYTVKVYIDLDNSRLTRIRIGNN